MTVLDLITLSHIETGAVAPDETLSSTDAAYGLTKFNLRLDEWTARKPFAFAMTFQAFTLTAGHGPTLIGPGLSAPDFNVSIRPQRIEGCNIILNTTPVSVDQPVVIRDADWWNYQRVKTLQSNIPTDLYYEPDFPNGQLNFWPVPNFNYGARIEFWALIQGSGQLALNTAISMPPAYQNALMLTLAIDLCPSLGINPSAALVENRRQAVKAVQANNDMPPRTSSRDAGMPRSGRNGKRADFNWENGRIV